MTPPDLSSVARTAWWLLLLRGVLAVLFGIVVLASPGVALLTLVVLFGVYAILDGITAVVLGVRHRRVLDHRGWQIADGVISVVAGLVALLFPFGTVLTLVLVLAVWAMAAGLMEIIQAVTMRKVDPSWGWALASGILTLLLGVVLLARPAAALTTLLLLLGIFTIASGVAMVVWAIRARRDVRAVTEGV